MDVLATPVKRWQIILSYFLSAVISVCLMTAAILTVGLIILSFGGNMHLETADVCRAYFVTALGDVSATAFFMVVVLMFKSSQASGAFFGMLSAAAGFVIGAYIPISQFSDSVQTVCNIFPASQVTILLRNTLLEGTLDSMDVSLGGMDGGAFVQNIREIFTFRARIFGNNMEANEMLLYVIIMILICILVQIVLFSKNYRKSKDDA